MREIMIILSLVICIVCGCHLYVILAERRLAKSIAKHIDLVYGCPYEISFFLDTKGKYILNCTNYSNEVCCPTPEEQKILERYPDLVQIHNHDEDVPPSISDLVFASKLNAFCTIVVTPNYVYHVHAPHGWPTESRILDAVSSNQSAFKIDYPDANDPDLMEITTTDLALNILARVLNLEVQRCSYPPASEKEVALHA